MNKQTYLDKLSFRNKELISKYDYSKLPEEFSFQDKISIGCPTHGYFNMKASCHFYNGNGCKQCAIEQFTNSRKLSQEDFINRVNKIHIDNNFDYSKTNYINNKQNVTITCKKHGDFNILPSNLFRGVGCKYCNKGVSKEDFIRKSNLIHNNKYNYSKVDYINTSTKIEIACPDHGSFFQEPYLHYGKKQGCPKCRIIEDKLTKEDFINKCNKIHNNKYDYSLVNYVTNKDIVKIICSTHGVFEQIARSHLSGNGCKQCSIDKNIKSNKIFINEAKTIHGDKYNYSKIIYIGNKKKVEIICPEHGSFYVKPNAHLAAKSGCPRCSESKGETSISITLDKFNIRYIREYRILPHRYRYDFYLPDYDIYIEYHGKQHYEPIDFFGGIETFQKNRERDLIKKQIIKEVGSNLIILTYLNSKDDILEKILIQNLKRIYKYWINVNGKILTYKNLYEVCRAYKLPMSTTAKTIESELSKVLKDFKIIF